MKPTSSKRKKTLPPLAPLPKCRGENPMLNNVIVMNLFAVNEFSLSDLKNFRLVCKLWGELALPSIRQQAWLTVRDAPYPGENIEDQLFLDQLMIMNLSNSPNLLLSKEMTKYKVIFNQIALASSESGKLQFWNTFGPLMTHLELYHHGSSSREELITVLFEETPNLEHLYLENSVVSRSHTHTENDRTPVWDEKFQPSPGTLKEKLITLEISLSDIENPMSLSWMYFLARIPNLRTLKLITCESNLEIPLLRLLESVVILREQLGLAFTFQLSQLDIIEAKGVAIEVFPSNVTGILRQLSFPLTSLAVEIGKGDDVQGFINLLEPYSNTLHKLVVRRSPFAIPLSQNFPFGVDLHHLKELVLVGPVCNNLNFLPRLPALKTLVFLDGAGDYDDVSKHRLNMTYPYLDVLVESCDPKNRGVIAYTNFFDGGMNTLVLPNMEELIVEHELVNAPDMLALARIMPNLKKLRLGMRNDGFKVACIFLNKLQHLDIEPSHVSEKGILGSENGEMYFYPNITNLKELVSLRLCHQAVPIVSLDQTPAKRQLSRKSIIHGLQAAQRLRDVEVPMASAKVHAMLASQFCV